MVTGPRNKTTVCYWLATKLPADDRIEYPCVLAACGESNDSRISQSSDELRSDMDFMNVSVVPDPRRRRVVLRMLTALLVMQFWLPQFAAAKDTRDKTAESEVVESATKVESLDVESPSLSVTPAGDAATTERPDSPVPERMEDMAAYLAAVRTHVETRPDLAAAYLVFWSELKSGVWGGAAPRSEEPVDPYKSLVTLAQQVSKEVKHLHRPASVESLVSDVLQQTLTSLASQPRQSATDQADSTTSVDAAERLVVNLDNVTTPRRNTDGRYEFTGALRTATAIGSSAEVWDLCKAIRACVKAHDQLFAPAMQGLSLIADVKQRLSTDSALAASPLWQNMQPIAHSMDAESTNGRTRKNPTLEERNDALRRSSQAQWRALLKDLPVAAGMQAADTKDGTATPDRSRLDALFTLGLAGAELTGNRQLAQAFSITRSPALEFASLASQGALAGSLATSMASVTLLVVGAQALSLLDGGDQAAREASAELRTFITALDARTYSAIMDARNEQLLAINAVDSRVASLGLSLDVVKTDIARLESASRRRVAAAFETDTARRWSDFDEANDRCFSLRHRDVKTNRLSPTDFRRCEDRFAQGATIKSRYSNRSSEYSQDARFITAADANFPFHQHYPLLLTQGGLDSRRALALPDPIEWQQNVAALLRLYSEHLVRAGEQLRRTETLLALQQAGERLRDALEALIVQVDKSGRVAFRKSLHEQALQTYLESLQKLADRVSKLDDPATHPFGKRLTVGLDQPLPSGAKRTVIEAELSRMALKGGALQVCPDAQTQAFLPQQDRVVAEARRFFGSPITAQEMTTAWNRDIVDELQLQLDDLASIVPLPYLWASLDGLGSLQICITRFRPETAAFTREDGPQRDTLRGSVIVGADIEVRYLPTQSLNKDMKAGAGAPVLLARYSAGRACTFSYRNDEEGCSRANCLKNIAPTLWGTDKRLTAKHVACEEDPLRTRLAASPRTGGTDSDRWVETLEQQYWQRQGERMARVEADALRSDEFEAASLRFLQYYALSGVVLGAYPETARLLNDLFAEGGRLTPRGALQAFVTQRRPVAEQLKALRQGIDHVLVLVSERGAELQDQGLRARLPPLDALADMQARIQLAGSVLVSARNDKN